MRVHSFVRSCVRAFVRPWLRRVSTPSAVPAGDMVRSCDVQLWRGAAAAAMEDIDKVMLRVGR